jgi:hypothetical protein
MKLTLNLGISGLKTSVWMIKLRNCFGCSVTEWTFHNGIGDSVWSSSPNDVVYTTSNTTFDYS